MDDAPSVALSGTKQCIYPVSVLVVDEVFKGTRFFVFRLGVLYQRGNDVIVSLSACPK